MQGGELKQNELSPKDNSWQKYCWMLRCYSRQLCIYYLLAPVYLAILLCFLLSTSTHYTFSGLYMYCTFFIRMLLFFLFDYYFCCILLPHVVDKDVQR